MSATGFQPVAVSDIDDTVTVAHQQAEAISAMFRSIARMSKDRDIQLLCRHGAWQADTVANDIDFLRERAVGAGLVQGGAV